ncbi:MAG TPA: hypothetical protein DDZ76_14880, partial [Xanthomonadales bacterium]|nr:hypothetical protein [Xanthomonadales bacterium]
ALDAAGLAAAVDAAALLEGTTGTLLGLDAAALSVLVSEVGVRLEQALSARGLRGARLDALLGTRQDAGEELPYLMGTQPYRIIGAQTPESVLPASERVQLAIDVRVDDNGLPGPSVVSFGQPVVGLYGQSLALQFVPASAEDRAVLAAMLPSTASGFVDLPEAVPAYLVEMQGELRLGGTLLAQSPVLGMGRGLYYEVSLSRPDGGRYRQRLRGHVGETRSFVLAWNDGVGAELDHAVAALRDRQSRLGVEAEVLRPLPSDLLRLTGLAHGAGSNAYQTWLAGLSRVAWHRSLSVTSSHVALEVEAPFGVVLSARPVGVGLSDVSPLHIGADLGGGDEAGFVRASLSAQSGFGYQVLEQIHAGSGRSALRVFQASLDAGSAVHSLSAEQVARFDGLTLPAGFAEPLRTGLLAGDGITFTETAQSVLGWVGHGGQQVYPDARGGTSFVFGRVSPDASAHLTGANVTALQARGLAWSGWLGEGLPSGVALAWVSEVERARAVGAGLAQLSTDPGGIGLSPTVLRLLASQLLAQTVSGRIAPVIEPHLWGRLLWPDLSIAPLLDPEPPTLSVAIEPSEIVLGERIVIRATASDNQPGVWVGVSIDGIPVPLVAGVAEYQPSQAGRVRVQVEAVDVAGNRVSQGVEVRVLAANDASAPQVRIVAPLDDAAVTAPTEVLATITDDSLVRWTLYLRPGNSPDVTPSVLAEGSQPVVNARIATLDPTLMFNGVYILILEAEDAAGRTSSDSIQVRIEGDMKLGQFSLSFVDAEVPLSGIPIRITRTYDSRQSGESLDFGHGWSVDYQNVRVRESRKLGFSWQLVQRGAGFGEWCIKPSGSPVVTVTLPDGETEQFRAKFSPECTAVVPTVYGQLVFEPLDARTQSRLEQLDFDTIRWMNLAGGRSDLIDLSDPEVKPIDPSRYKLTTEDGTIYLIDQGFGVRSIEDQAGNRIEFSAAGIVHSSGVGVTFERDGQGRITGIVLPDGRRLSYGYDGSGDLVAMRDPADFVTRFGYLANVRYPHYLQDIIDARGVRAVRNEYDDDGRLVASIDANGERIEFVHDIAGRIERVKNRRGFE